MGLKFWSYNFVKKGTLISLLNNNRVIKFRLNYEMESDEK